MTKQRGKVYFVIAEASAGKSATIRALTGARVRRSWKLAIGKPEIVQPTWIEIRSLQEQGFSPDRAIAEIDSNCRLAIIALRFPAYNHQPAAQEYIDAFVNEGWRVAGVCKIGRLSGSLDVPGDPIDVKCKPIDENSAANQRAAKLRKAWSIT